MPTCSGADSTPLDPQTGSTVFIENVGNLVCPALFDLGETARVVVVSVTEGDDKPQKYPHMFRAADLVIVNKADLLPYVEFDVDACLRQIRQLDARAPNSWSFRPPPATASPGWYAPAGRKSSSRSERSLNWGFL